MFSETQIYHPVILQNLKLYFRITIFYLPMVFLEVMGAILSVLIIWVLTGVLVYEAIERIVKGNHKVNANIMLIVAACGVGVNIV